MKIMNIDNNSYTGETWMFFVLANVFAFIVRIPFVSEICSILSVMMMILINRKTLTMELGLIKNKIKPLINFIKSLWQKKV